MFKRVEKRRRKQEEEEQLGLDGDLKQVLGLNETDSEESESSSGSDTESSSPEEKVEHDDAFGGDTESEDDGRPFDETEFDITAHEALKEPIIVISVQPVVKACIVCPGKLLKSEQMVALHRTSNSHQRRFKQFTQASAHSETNGSASDIVARGLNSQTPKVLEHGESKRAMKRKAQTAFLKAKRTKRKEQVKAKRAKETKSLDRETASAKELLKKKRTLNSRASMSKETREAPSDGPISGAPEKDFPSALAVSSIARSTAQRAKQARVQALTKKVKERKTNIKSS